jgi:hypothetical protein
MQQPGSVTLRIAGSADGAELLRLAQLDSRPLPPGPHLIAERDGRADAALSLASGETVADPFRPTADLCELLHRHAKTAAAPLDASHSAALRKPPILKAA